MTVLFLASFINLIGVTIVNVALPSIQKGLGAGSTQLEWVAVVYVLALAIGLLPCGRFGDIFGRKRVFLLGLTGFTISSAFCGVAPSIDLLIAARAVQGIAAAMMVPQVLAIVHVIFPANEKGRVFGFYAAISSLGSVAGPLLGGAVISADLWGLDWRPVFLINVPLGLIALIGAIQWVPDLPQDERIKPDWGGMLLFTVVIILLLLPLVEGRNLGWPWWSFVAMATSLLFALLFLRWEKRQAARGEAELLPASLLANRSFMSGVGLVTLFFSGIPGLFLILAVFFQSGFGMTALQSGLATAPFPIGVMIASTLMGRLDTRWPHGRIAVGALLLVGGMVLLNVVIRGTGEVMNATPFILPLLVCGCGMGIAVMALFQMVLDSVSNQDAGAGSGALQAFQQVGAGLGIAIVGQIFFASLGEATLAAGSTASSAFIDAAARSTWYPVATFILIALSLGWQAIRKQKELRRHV